MRTIFASCAALALLAFPSLAADWQSEYARLLKKYVAPNGVRYAEWKANPADLRALQEVVGGIARAPASAAKTREQLAFYINAYNAWILNEVLEKYPTKSVKDPLFTFFTGNRITVAGEKMSFNRLEKDIIRPRFNEPRVHFALNCASRSCPPLRNEPYTGAQLEGQLEDQARDFLNTDRGVRVSGDSAQASKIFDWYKDEFGGQPGIAATLAKYRKGKPAFKTITFQEYDWALNEAR